MKCHHRSPELSRSRAFSPFVDLAIQYVRSLSAESEAQGKLYLGNGCLYYFLKVQDVEEKHSLAIGNHGCYHLVLRASSVNWGDVGHRIRSPKCNVISQKKTQILAKYCNIDRDEADRVSRWSITMPDNIDSISQSTAFMIQMLIICH